jgi:asparagine synthase (glutamine-hydrolysing)
MCGIGGILVGSATSGPGPELDLNALGRRMVERLHHRGPEARGVSLLPNGRGMLAHTRLKIVDLSERAAQPFVSADGRCLLTFNGEIYNFQSLRAALAADGTEFRSSSDTEVILEQYRRHGVRGLDALDGMFAFALYDADADRLVLMRDRVGKKPLYWTRLADGSLLFGSEIKALAADPRLPLEIEPAHLPEYLAYGYVTTPRSLYRGVHKLPPASRMVIAPGGEPEISRYWSLDERTRPVLRLPLEDAKRRVREAIGRAVERRLIADVPVGAFLSGGIDSSIVVAEMARRSARPVRTFAVGFEEASFDERVYAREIAQRFGADHTELEVSATPTGLLEKLLEHHDEPYGDSSALAVYAVSEATKRHVTVVLTGDGGDEVFAGYTRFRGGLLAGVLPAPLTRALRGALERLPEPRGYKNPVALLRRFVEHGDRSGDEQLLAWNSYFAGPALKGLLRPEVYPTLDPWSVLEEQASILAAARASGRDRLDQILRHNLATYLLDDLLVKTDRMTMAVALEARCPFLDADLIELAFQLPSSLKMRYGQLKWLLREAYRGILPASVLDRKKHGFGVPVSGWWSGPQRALVDDLLLAPSARIAAYLSLPAVAAIVAEHREGRRDHGNRIFTLIQLELWLRSIERGAAERGRQAA